MLFSSSRRLRAYCETAAAPCKAPSTVQVIGGNTTVERAASGHTLAPTAALGDVTKVVQTNSGLLVAAGRDGLKLVLP